MINLDQYGSAGRCLLRLLENEGNPIISDASFLAQFSSRFPSGQKQPGITSTFAIFALAKQLGLATDIEIYRDYERILQEYRTGRAVLVRTGRNPAQEETTGAALCHVMLLESIDEKEFVCRSPFQNGTSDRLPPAGRIWWDRWLALGIVLYE